MSGLVVPLFLSTTARAIQTELYTRCPAATQTILAGSYTTALAAAAQAVDAVHLPINDIDVYYSCAKVQSEQGFRTEDSDLTFLSCSCSYLELEGKQVEINWIHLQPFSLETLIRDFDINCVLVGVDITVATEPTWFKLAAFTTFLQPPHVIRAAKVQSDARVCTRMAYKAMQLQLPCDYGDLDPSKGEMSGLVYTSKLAQLRRANFPQPQIFQGLVLRERLEPGAFANTGGPRNFQFFERTTTSTYWGEER